ncbi:DMT family transporter [Comamonadaceae bacterium OH2545_COT-014]|nr:DMT family transporter [Comamonadaceae bacterium OH2545_COT-014]
MRTGFSWDSRAAGIACGLASALIWGAFPVVTRLGLSRTALDAWDVTVIRYTVSGLILLPLLWRQGRQGVGWGAAALMVCGIGAPYMLVVALGLARAPVEQFAVVTPSSMIVFAAALSALWLGLWLTRRQGVGMALILAGVALAGWRALGAASRAELGAWALFLTGGALWAVYTVVSRRHAASALHATALVSVGSMALCLPPYLAWRGARLWQLPLADVLVQALYQGVMVSVLALFFFSQAVRVLGPAVGALFAALVPLAATLLAAWQLGEQPRALAWAGLALTTAGMALALWPGRGKAG